jgi:micrococcal nuclease
MEGACLAGAHLNRAFLPDAQLEGAALTRADLRHALFWYDLRAADLTSAGLDHAANAGEARWPPGYHYRSLVHPNPSAKPPASPVVARGETRPAVVHSVFDGDTLTLTGIAPRPSRLVPVRLIGVDAPDRKEEGGLAAREFLEKRLTVGARVMYRYDRRTRDAFERRLLYVFLRNGELVNQMLVQQGLAVENVDPPSDLNGNRLYARQLSASEVWARQHALGLWRVCPP